MTKKTRYLKKNKEVYEMHNGIPVWLNIIKDGEEKKTILRGSDYGRLAERVGKREIKRLVNEGLIDKMFPDVIVLGFHKISTHKGSKKREAAYANQLSDRNYEISCRHKTRQQFSRKILLFEIKHGKVQISQQQIHKYANMIINPSAYFRKADEVKVVFMIFKDIDTTKAEGTYIMSEFSKEFAAEIASAIPERLKADENGNLFNMFDEYDNKL